jgi:hypothetical protein
VKAPEPLTDALVVGRRPIPDWIREAVIHQVFVDRFAPDPGTPFQTLEDLSGCFGGTLRGQQPSSNPLMVATRVSSPERHPPRL